MVVVGACVVVVGACVVVVVVVEGAGVAGASVAGGAVSIGGSPVVIAAHCNNNNKRHTMTVLIN